jgi:ATP-dependent Clp protease, protease subunit
MRPCFAFKNLASSDEAATLSIYDEIGFWGVQAKDFVSDLSKVQSKSLNVEINSPGGDVFAGLAIYNALKSSGKEINVKVMGVAASAASLIAMAGDKISMPKNTFMMIHNPWSFAMGNADELREQANVLDKIGTSLLQTYAARTGKSEDEIAPLLAKDTWLTADEALEMGFATEVVDDIKANASFDMARAELPDNVKMVFQAAAEQAPEEPVAEEPPAEEQTDEGFGLTVAETIEAAAKDAGMEAYASVWAVACASVDELKSKMAEAKEITALYAFAKKPEMAQAAIRAGKSVTDVRAELVKALATEDEQTHTDNTSPSNEQATRATAKPKVTTAALWASHNGHK